MAGGREWEEESEAEPSDASDFEPSAAASSEDEDEEMGQGEEEEEEDGGAAGDGEGAAERPATQAELEERRQQNIRAMVSGTGLALRRQALLPRMLTVQQVAVVLRRPFKSPHPNAPAVSQVGCPAPLPLSLRLHTTLPPPAQQQVSPIPAPLRPCSHACRRLSSASWLHATPLCPGAAASLCPSSCPCRPGSRSRCQRGRRRQQRQRERRSQRRWCCRRAWIRLCCGRRRQGQKGSLCGLTTC